MNVEGKPSEVSLSNCDSEPIHIPASIQPHGMLMVLREPDLTLTQVSENVGEYTGRSVEQALQRPLSLLLGPAVHDMVSAALNNGRWEDVNPLRLEIENRRMDGIVHRHEGAVILELEAAPADLAKQFVNDSLRRVLISLQSTGTLASLFEVVVRQLRQLTGFERVVLYRFHAGGDGSVEAEAKSDFLESYLGLHYPASDIPKQARELYRKNWVRIIPDARYVPVRIVPTLRADTNTPLDLSFAVLRSVSPIHLEYMANQGVRASMSISLVVRDRLWGLITCANHSAPRYVPFEIRSTCEALGRVTSLQISAIEERQAEIGRLSRRGARNVLAETLRSGAVLKEALAVPNELMGLVEARGVAVLTGADIGTVGHTPPRAAISALADWLETRHHTQLFTTSCLSSLYPAALEFTDSASGILTFSMPGAGSRRIIWFRPQVLQNVDWGGNPFKPVHADPRSPIHPRRSFALWREEVRAHCLLWTETDLEAAEQLRRDATEIDLERQIVREQDAVRARDDLVAVVSHDLRSPLGVIHMQAAILLQTVGGGRDEFSRRVQSSAGHIQRSAARMSTLIQDLLDLAKLEAGRFSLECLPHQIAELIEESLIILRPLAEDKGLELTAELQPTEVLVDRDRIFQVLANLLGNAIKFTPASGRVVVRSESLTAEVRIAVSDTGPGIPADAHLKIFERYWQAGRREEQGSGLGLFIAKGIVEAHGGRIWIEPRTGRGATFVFTLPRPGIVH